MITKAELHELYSRESVSETKIQKSVILNVSEESENAHIVTFAAPYRCNLPDKGHCKIPRQARDDKVVVWDDKVVVWDDKVVARGDSRS